jgi:hypothetical protein
MADDFSGALIPRRVRERNGQEAKDFFINRRETSEEIDIDAPKTGFDSSAISMLRKQDVLDLRSWHRLQRQSGLA